MKDTVEDELKLRPSRSQDRVKARTGLEKRFLRLILHHPDHHQQTCRQRDAARRDQCRQGVLAKAAVDDQRKGHRSFTTEKDYS